MKAFRFETVEKGLLLEDMPIPEPEADQVQIRVMATGICHSDCHVVDGHGAKFVTHTPITLGHEVSGVITKLGSSVTDLEIGTRVAVVIPCYPVEIIDLSLGIGLGYDGGHAEYATVPTSRIIKIPDEVSFAAAAVATDALAGSYHAVVTEAEAAPGKKIAIIGIGGLGMPGLRFGALKGAEVYGIDIAESKFAEAMSLGATACFRSLAEARHIRFDAVVDFYGSSETTAAAVKAVKRGGKVVGVGLQSPVVSIPSVAAGYIAKTVTLVGSLGSSMDEILAVIELVRSGAYKPNLIEVPFLEIPATLALLSKNAGVGRYWANPSKGRWPTTEKL